MAELEVRTDEFSDDLVAARRTIVGDGIRVETPTAAVQAKKLQKTEDVDPSVCGVQEVYRTFGDDDLTAASRGTNTQFIDDFANQAHDVEGMLTAAFLRYTETGELSRSDAAMLVDILAAVGDFITVPLMPKTARLIGEDGTEDPHRDAAYQDYRTSVERLLEMAAERAPEMSVMGVLPMVGWTYMKDLFSLYDQHGVRMYCLNFDRSRITAGTKISMIRPLQRHIAEISREDDVVLYGMNMTAANHDDALGIQPADDFNGLGMGLDIIGGSHERLRGPSEMFEEMEGEETFKLFDRIQSGYRQLPPDQIAVAIPDNIEPDGEYIQRRVEAGTQSTRRRLEKVVNAQQKAHAADDVRDALNDDRAAEELADRVGVTQTTIEAFRQVRRSFDDGRSQSNLGDF
jgi:hypothetical protein